MSITKADGGGESLNNTEFLWNKPDIVQSDISRNCSSLPGFIYPSTKTKYFQGDFNGDGIMDILNVSWDEKNYPDANKCVLLYGGKDGGGNSRVFDLPRSKFVSTWPYSMAFCPPDMPEITLSSKHIADIAQVITGDFDGDGITEMLVAIREYNLNPYACNYLMEDPNFNIYQLMEPEADYTWYIYTFENNEMTLKNRLKVPFYPESVTLDFNNDGRTEIMKAKDIYRLQGDNFVKTGTTNVEISDLEKACWGDFNGDGILDFACGNEVYLREYNSYTFTKAKTFDNKKVLGTKSYGYEKTNDIILLDDESVIEEITIHTQPENYKRDPEYTIDEYAKKGYIPVRVREINLCVNNRCDPIYEIIFARSGNSIYIYNYNQNSTVFKSEWIDSRITHIHNADFNGDGRTDIACFSGKKLTCIIYETSASHVKEDKNIDLGKNHFSGDFTGDGNTNIISTSKKRLYSFIKGNSPAHIYAIRDGMGNKSKIEYKPLTDKTVYTKGSGAVYPLVDIVGALWVVSSIEQDNGVADNIFINYYYEGAKANIHGKGLLGFTKIKTENITSGLISQTTTAFNTTYGVPSTITITNTLGGKTTESKITYSIATLNSAQKRFRQYIYSQVEKDINGNTLTKTTNSIDTYGNTTRETISYGSGVYTENRYYYNTINSSAAYISLPDSITVKNTRNNKSVIQSTVFTYRNYLPDTKTQYYNHNRILREEYDYNRQNLLSALYVKKYDATVFLIDKYEYDNSGRLIKHSNPLGRSIKYVYDDSGLLTSSVDIRGNTTTYEYTSFRRKSKTRAPGGIVTENKLDWDRNYAGPEGTLYYIQTTTGGKPTEKTYYDAAGRELRSSQMRFNGAELTTDKQYDARGRLLKTSLPSTDTPNLWNICYYDAVNRPQRIEYASGKRDYWSYSGNSITTTQENIRTTKNYDASGALLSVSDPGGTISYHLRPDGQPDSIIVTGNIVTRFEYDKYGRQIKINDPSGGVQLYGYDAMGNLNYSKDANNKVTSMTYDNYNRITRKTHPEFYTSYEYNSYGEISFVNSSNNTSYDFVYDNLGRISKETEYVPDGKYLEKTFSYNTQGNLQSINYKSQSGNITTENYYYQNGHLKEIRLNSQIPIWSLVNEDKFGSPENVNTGIVNRRYNSGRYGYPNYRRAYVNGSNIFDHLYEFDTFRGNLNFRDNRISRTMEDFEYDNLNRLIKYENQSLNHQGPHARDNRSISYLNNGNIANISGIGLFRYQFTDKPYAVSEIQANNNEPLAIHIPEHTISYTSFNRPAKIISDTYQSEFTYNDKGDRVKMSDKEDNMLVSTRYYIGGKYEIESGNNNSEYLYLGGDAYSAPAVYIKQGSSWNIYYICRDYLGSICAITNSDGNVVAEYDYDAWGRMRDPATQEIYTTENTPELLSGRGFTGHEHLSRYGLINMNARLYDPVTGRFLSPDPYIQNADFTQAYNRYSYAWNNPLKYTDESGEFIEWLIAGAILLGKAYYEGYKGNNKEKNPAKWDWKNANYGISFGSTGGDLAISAGVGWNNNFVNIGYSQEKGFGFSYGEQGISNLAYPFYNPYSYKNDPVYQAVLMQEQEHRNNYMVQRNQTISSYGKGLYQLATGPSEMELLYPEYTYDNSFDNHFSSFTFGLTETILGFGGDMYNGRAGKFMSRTSTAMNVYSTYNAYNTIITNPDSGFLDYTDFIFGTAGVGSAVLKSFGYSNPYVGIAISSYGFFRLGYDIYNLYSIPSYPQPHPLPIYKY